MERVVEMTIWRMVVAALVLMVVDVSQAEVRLPKIFSDHMVLQRDMPIPIWGWAAPGERVTVKVGTTFAAVTADSIGCWSVTLPARPAGGGAFDIRIAGTNTVELKDVLMGDIWMASGQSNMEFPMTGFGATTPLINGASEIAAANIPEIRLMFVKEAASAYPLADLNDDAPWMICNPQNVRKFSAVAYFFGREIHEQVRVPIGLIDSTWGGTPAERWISLDGLAASPVVGSVMAARANDMNHVAANLQKGEIESRAEKTAVMPPTPSGDNVIKSAPSALYNAMIAPIVKMPIKGVIWYQGESNAMAARASYYEVLFEALITDWRAKWKEPYLPFFFVQLAGYSGNAYWPRIREAQRGALILDKVGMAVAIDLGEEHNVHPGNKQAVGHRLALQAEAQVYGESVVKDGPVFKQANAVGGAMEILFDSADGLKAVGELDGFEVAGADGVFKPATAAIHGTMVVAKCADVPAPMYVRYMWVDWPKVAGLYNGSDLPAAPFTSR